MATRWIYKEYKDVSVQNALVLLGDNPNFVDVYTYFNDDSKLNLGGLFGGKLGTRPGAVMEYLEDNGHDATMLDFRTEVFERPGTYIMVYGWQNGSNISAHFQTAQSDGKIVNTYNGDKTYDLSINNPEDPQSIEMIKKDNNMLTVEESWLLGMLTNPLEHITMKLTDDDTYFSYIIAID